MKRFNQLLGAIFVALFVFTATAAAQCFCDAPRIPYEGMCVLPGDVQGVPCGGRTLARLRLEVTAGIEGQN